MLNGWDVFQERIRDLTFIIVPSLWQPVSCWKMFQTWNETNSPRIFSRFPQLCFLCKKRKKRKCETSVVMLLRQWTMREIWNKFVSGFEINLVKNLPHFLKLICCIIMTVIFCVRPSTILTWIMIDLVNCPTEIHRLVSLSIKHWHSTWRWRNLASRETQFFADFSDSYLDRRLTSVCLF